MHTSTSSTVATPAVFDLSAYSLEELVQLKHAVINQRKVLEMQAWEQTRQKILAMATEAGMSLGHLFPELGLSLPPQSTLLQQTGRMPVIIRYAHPHKPDLLWSGRGRQPIWLRTWLQQGGTIEDCRVPLFSLLPKARTLPAPKGPQR